MKMKTYIVIAFGGFDVATTRTKHLGTSPRPSSLYYSPSYTHPLQSRLITEADFVRCDGRWAKNCVSTLLENGENWLGKKENKIYTHI